MKKFIAILIALTFVFTLTPFAGAAAADDAPDNWEAWRSLKDPIPDYQQPALTEWKRTSEFSEITFSRYERLRLKDTLFCLCTCVVRNAFIGYLLFRFWFLRDLTSCLCVRDIALWIILTPFILIGFCLFVFMLKQILVPFTVQTIQLTRTEVSLGTSIFGLKQTKRFQYWNGGINSDKTPKGQRYG